MRIVLQRVARASVSVDDRVIGSIDSGLLLLVGVAATDSTEDVERAVEKVANMRVFPDEEGLMNRSLLDVGGSALVVSQFTLLADIRKGRRPSFTRAAVPELAEPMIGRFVAAMRETGIPTETGLFGASMEVALLNDGPVTIVMDVTGGQAT